MKAQQVVEGEWIAPASNNFRLGCCDCGLVHDIDVRIVKGKLQLRAFRNNRSTALNRRHRGIKVTKS